jgi:hypothetical protein
MATIGARLPFGGRAGVSNLPRHVEVVFKRVLIRLIVLSRLFDAACCTVGAVNIATFPLLASGKFSQVQHGRLRAYVKLSRGSAILACKVQ